MQIANISSGFSGIRESDWNCDLEHGWEMSLSSTHLSHVHRSPLCFVHSEADASKMCDICCACAVELIHICVGIPVQQKCFGCTVHPQSIFITLQSKSGGFKSPNLVHVIQIMHIYYHLRNFLEYKTP